MEMVQRRAARFVESVESKGFIVENCCTTKDWLEKSPIFQLNHSNYSIASILHKVQKWTNGSNVGASVFKLAENEEGRSKEHQVKIHINERYILRLKLR